MNSKLQNIIAGLPPKDQAELAGWEASYQDGAKHYLLHYQGRLYWDTQSLPGTPPDVVTLVPFRDRQIAMVRASAPVVTGYTEVLCRVTGNLGQVVGGKLRGKTFPIEALK